MPNPAKYDTLTDPRLPPRPADKPTPGGYPPVFGKAWGDGKLPFPYTNPIIIPDKDLIHIR
jgi:hypothetical protein